jgi:hypothetical protein
LGSFCENYRSSTDNRAASFHGKIDVLIITKIVWATFWAIFFTNASGHPAFNVQIPETFTPWRGYVRVVNIFISTLGQSIASTYS